MNDVLNCCEEISVEPGVMDSYASFHATHNNETLKNMKKLVILERYNLQTMKFLMLGMDDIEMQNLVGITWNFKISGLFLA